MVLLKDDKAIAARTFVWTCGIQGCEFAANLRLVKGKCSNRLCKFATTQGTCGLKECQFGGDRYVEGKRGRLLVNERMQTPGLPRGVRRGRRGLVPRGQEGAAADRRDRRADGRDRGAQHHRGHPRRAAPKSHRSNYHGNMVSIGAKWGVAYVGMGRMMIPLSGIFAMAAKHAINVLHFLGVAGINQVWEYLQARVPRREAPPLGVRRPFRRARRAATGWPSCGCSSA